MIPTNVGTPTPVSVMMYDPPNLPTEEASFMWRKHTEGYYFYLGDLFLALVVPEDCSASDIPKGYVIVADAPYTAFEKDPEVTPRVFIKEKLKTVEEGKATCLEFVLSEHKKFLQDLEDLRVQRTAPAESKSAETQTDKAAPNFPDRMISAEPQTYQPPVSLIPESKPTGFNYPLFHMGAFQA